MSFERHSSDTFAFNLLAYRGEESQIRTCIEWFLKVKSTEAPSLARFEDGRLETQQPAYRALEKARVKIANYQHNIHPLTQRS